MADVKQIRIEQQSHNRSGTMHISSHLLGLNLYVGIFLIHSVEVVGIVELMLSIIEVRSTYEPTLNISYTSSEEIHSRE